MRKYISLCIAMTFMACTNLKKATTRSQVSNAATVVQSKQQLQQLAMVKMASDSSELEEEVLLWPKGVVKYAGGNGFEGELHQMRIRRKDKRQVQQNEMRNETLFATQDLALQQDQKEVVKTFEKKKLNFKFLSWSLVSLGLIGAIAYLFYKKKIIWVKA